MADFLETFQAGLTHHRQGRLGEAERLYRRVLEIHPRHAGAAHLLGLIALQIGRHDVAAEYVEQAVAFDAHHAPYRADLGEIYRATGRAAEAIASYRKALELDPQMAAAHVGLGQLLESNGDHEEAEACYRQALAADPESVAAHIALGAWAQSNGRLDDAQSLLEKAAQLAPENPDAYFHLGRCLEAGNKPLEAIACYLKVTRLQPDSHDAHYQLGLAYQARGQLDQAAAHFTQAIELTPNLADAHFKLAIVRRDQGRTQEALASFGNALKFESDKVDVQLSVSGLYMQHEQPDEAAAFAGWAVKVRPESTVAVAQLARALALQGDLKGATAELRRVVELEPENAAAHSHWLSARNADPAIDATTLWAEHRAWAQQHAERLTAKARPHAKRVPQERLRIGYVSPHFRQHPNRSFCEPLLAAHDHAAFEIFCYSNSNSSDAVTARFQQTADHWRPIAELSDEAAADLIRQDAIDILVDLAGHSPRGRLLTLARKPAPVQVTYLGYPNTTGMSAVDYRLTDAHADPPGASDAFYSEKLVRLPRSLFCYAPPEPSAEVSPLPAIAAGHVTFGWFGGMTSMTPEALDTWARILSSVPGARLLVLAYRSAVFQGRVNEAMTCRGVDPARVEIVVRGSQDESTAVHHRVDVSLDSFPTSGPATITSALWTGVPSLVRLGTTYASRLGGTALTNLGLDDLVAHSPDDYVRIATELAGDVPRLAALRGELRERLRGSPLLDAAGFTRYVEHAYRQMWRAWCRPA